MSEEELQGLVGPLLRRSGAYASALLGNQEDAEDAVQEAIWKAYRGRARYDLTQGFEGWWFAILRRCCLDLHRRRRAGPATVALDTAAPNGGVQAQWEEVDRRLVLRRALDQLPPAQREIIELRHFGDCSYREIAAVLRIPLGTVMSRLHAARQSLIAICGSECE